MHQFHPTKTQFFAKIANYRKSKPVILWFLCIIKIDMLQFWIKLDKQLSDFFRINAQSILQYASNTPVVWRNEYLIIHGYTRGSSQGYIMLRQI